jgi:hypothetical protein
LSNYLRTSNLFVAQSALCAGELEQSFGKPVLTRFGERSSNVSQELGSVAIADEPVDRSLFAGGAHVGLLAYPVLAIASYIPTEQKRSTP